MGYELVAVSRVPATSGPPTLTEIEGIAAPSITWTDEIGGTGSIGFSCGLNVLKEPVKARLANLDAFPTEVWLYRNGTRIAAGVVEGYTIQGGTLSVSAPGLLHYLAYMQVDADLIYSNDDQFAIAAGLIEQWQALPYGDYGIDTTSVGTSGVTRDRTYLAAEQHNVLQRFLELTRVNNGFDAHVDPATRELVLSYPRRGSDLTGSVVVDARNITNAGITVSVAPGDLASEAYGQGTSSDSEVATSLQSNTTLRQAWGRAAVAANFDGVSLQATLDAHTQALLDARSDMLFIPGPGLIPVEDVDVEDFTAGDTIAYSYDAGLGRQDINGRVARKQVSVNQDGGETISVAFA